MALLAMWGYFGNLDSVMTNCFKLPELILDVIICLVLSQCFYICYSIFVVRSS